MPLSYFWAKPEMTLPQNREFRRKALPLRQLSQWAWLSTQHRSQPLGCAPGPDCGEREDMGKVPGALQKKEQQDLVPGGPREKEEGKLKVTKITFRPWDKGGREGRTDGERRWPQGESVWL